MVFASKIIWRKIDASENPLIFNQNILEIIYNELKNNKIVCYTEDFCDSIDNIKLPAIDTIKMVGIKTKELWFFDTYRFIAEKRLISFIPLITTKNSPDTIDLGSFYFPYLRKILADIKIKSNLANINTIDDLFFFNFFSARTYKIEGIKNYGNINDDLFLMEQENDIICNFY